MFKYPDNRVFEEYAYIELVVSENREWVYERASDQTALRRIGTEQDDLWRRLRQLTQEGWRVHQVYQATDKKIGKYLAYLLEKVVVRNV